MSTTNLNNSSEAVITGNDSIVIVDNLQSIRGGRSLEVYGYLSEVIKAGHVIIMQTSNKEFKPMPATEATTGNIATFGSITGGSAYTNGTYTNVPLTGGSGTGALATVVVASNAVSSVTRTRSGKDYKVSDALSADADTVGGTGTGFSIPVATITATDGAYGALPAGHVYAGILIGSILTKKPFAGIMVRGTVNPAAAPFSMTSILSAVKAALPLIDFRED